MYKECDATIIISGAPVAKTGASMSDKYKLTMMCFRSNNLNCYHHKQDRSRPLRNQSEITHH